MSVSFSSNQSNYQNNKYTTPLYGNCSILLPKNQENSENWYCSIYNKPINIDLSKCSRDRASVLSKMQNLGFDNGKNLFSSGYLLRYMNQFLVSEELIV